MGWIIPIRASEKPEVELGHIQVFYALSEYFGPPARKAKKKGTAGALGGGYDEIQILEQKRLDIFDISVLRATDENQLYNWLNENAFKIKDHAKKTLGLYTNSDFFFIAVKLDLPPDSQDTLRKLAAGIYSPLKITFKTDRAFFPLRISSINGGVVTVTAYVIAKGPREDSSGILKVSKWQPLAEDFKPRIAYCLPLDGLRTITRLDFKGHSLEFRRDAYFSQMASKKTVIHYSDHYKKLNLTPEGWLNTAVHHGDLFSVKKAIDAGADVNKAGTYGPPLHHAVTSPGRYYGLGADDTIDIIETILDAGADIDLRDPAGCTALHMAVSQDIAADTIPLLVERGASMNLCDDHGWTPLRRAILYGRHRERLEVVDLLIRHGAKLSVTGLTDSGDTSRRARLGSFLAEAAEAGKDKVVELLVKHGVSPDGDDSCKMSPLMSAIRGVQLESARILLDHGSDANRSDSLVPPNKPDSRQQKRFRPIDLAVYLDSREMVGLLLDYDARLELPIFREEGHDPQVLPLISAIRNGNIEMARLLIEHGASTNSGIPMPLIAAVEQGNPAMTELLLQNGAHPNSSVSSDSALELALRMGNRRIIDVIRRYGGIVPDRGGFHYYMTNSDAKKLKLGMPKWQVRDFTHGHAAVMSSLLRGHVVFRNYLLPAPVTEAQQTINKRKDPNWKYPRPTDFYLIFKSGRLVDFGDRSVLRRCVDENADLKMSSKYDSILR
jgi:ankyrin repeat protein